MPPTLLFSDKPQQLLYIKQTEHKNSRFIINDSAHILYFDRLYNITHDTVTNHCDITTSNEASSFWLNCWLTYVLNPKKN